MPWVILYYIYIYIYIYLIGLVLHAGGFASYLLGLNRKRQLHATARTFQAEGNVSTNPIGKIII